MLRKFATTSLANSAGLIALRPPQQTGCVCSSRQIVTIRPTSIKKEVFLSPNKPIETYEEYMQKMYARPEPKIPASINRLWQQFRFRVLRKRGIQDTLNRDLKELFDKSAAQLYYSCANNDHHLVFCKEFGLPDYISTWFKITILHVWMILFRLHVSLDAPSFERFHHSILSALWVDVEKRIKIMDEHSKQRHSVNEMRQIHASFIQSYMEFDEGYLMDDRSLAAALWRNLYMEESVDPINLANAVKYIRATISFLDGINSNDLLVSGIKHWRPAEQLHSHY